MGCRACNKNSQIVEPLTKIVEEKVEEVDPFKFDANKARKLIKILLSEDSLYYKTLNYIILFNDEELENLFFGNYEYKNFPYHNIPNSSEFRDLLYKFEDFNSFLFEWYKDEAKYDNLIKLWKSRDFISKYSEYSDEKLEKKFRELEINDLDFFIEEFRRINSNSIEKKGGDIKNYIQDNYDDFNSLLCTTLDYKKQYEKSNIEKKEIYTVNLENIAKKLVKQSLPLIKDYIFKKYPKLNIFSQIQLKKDEMLTKLTKKLFGEINNDSNITSHSFGFESLPQLYDNLKNGSLAKHLWSDVKAHYNNPTTAYVCLATSLLNLANSVKSYYDNKIEMTDFNEEMRNKFGELNEQFEIYKNEIGELDLDNYEESLKKIKTAAKKISYHKLVVKDTIEYYTKEKKEKEEKNEKESYKDIIKSGGSFIGSALGVIATGGILAGVFAVSAVASGIAAGISIAKFKMIKKQLDISKKNIEEQEKKEKEIDEKLNELRVYYEEIQNRYIPRNILNGN